MSNNDLKKDGWRQALSASAALWLTICFFGPLLLELTKWPVSDLWAYIITLFTVSLILTVLTSFVLVRLIPSRLFELATVLVLIFGFVVYARVFVFHNLAEMLPNTIFSIRISRHYFAIGALLFSVVLAATWVMRRPVVRNITIVAIVFIAYQTIFANLWWISAPIPKPKYWHRLTNDYSNSFSKSQNILVLLFDAFDTDDFKVILDNNNFSGCFEGFTFYPDSLGGYNDTTAAIPHILTGLFHDNSEPLNEFLSAKLPKESIPGMLKKASFRTEAYGYGAQYALYEPVLDNITTEKRIFLEPPELARIIMQFVIRFTPDYAWKYLIDAYIKVSSGTPYGFQFLGSAYDLIKIEQLQKLAQADTIDPVFKYEHFWGAHDPYVLSETMQIRRRLFTSKARIDQATSAVKLCCKYLGVLKKIGVYDKSMIFVIADHGYLEKPSFPLFMWKPFNDSQPFRISSKPVAQEDIIRTICDELSIPLSRFNSESVREESSGSKRIRRRLPYTGRPVNPVSGYIPELREFIVTGRRDSLLLSTPTFRFFQPRSVEVIPRLEIGSILEFRKEGNYYGYLSAIGWSAPQANIVWNHGQKAGLFLPINNYGRAVNISIQCQPRMSAPHITGQRLKVIGGNGRLLFEGKLTEPSTITFLAPPDAFEGELLPLYFHFPNLGGVTDLERAPNDDGISVGFESITVTN